METEGAGMEQPELSPDLNPIENLWDQLVQKLLTLDPEPR